MPEILEDTNVDLKHAILKLDAITKELDRRQKENGIRYYIPNKIQFCAHRSIARTIMMVAGNRAGKTSFGAVELAWHLTREYPGWFPKARRFYGPIKAVVVATSFPVIERVIEKKILTYLPKEYILRLKRTPDRKSVV